MTPLDHNSEDKFYISINNEVYGPYTVDEINSLIKNQEVEPSVLVCKEGEEEWSEFSEITATPSTYLENPSHRSQLHQELPKNNNSYRENNKVSKKQNRKKQLSKSFDLSDFIFYLREWWFASFAISILLASLVFFFLLKQERIYENYSKLLIYTRGEKVLGMDEVQDESIRSGMDIEIALNRHLKKLNSKRFHKYVKERFQADELEKILEPYREEKIKYEDIMAKNLRITRDPDSQTFTLVFKHPTNTVTTLVCNRYASTYEDFTQIEDEVENQNASSFLDKQAEELKQQVKESETALQEYRQEQQLVSLEENQNIIVERLKELSNIQTRTKIAYLDAESKWKQTQQVTAEELVNIPFIAGQEKISKVLQSIQETSAKRAKLSEELLNKHPEMLENAAQLEELKQSLSNNIQSAVEELKHLYNSSKEQLSSIERELANAEKEALELDQKAIAYNALKRKLEKEKKTYEKVLERINEKKLSNKLENRNIQVMDYAENLDDDEYVWPNKKIVVFISGFTFITFFTAIPCIFGFFDNRLKTFRDVEVFLDQNLLGAIPKVKTVNRRAPFFFDSDVDPALENCFLSLYSSMDLSSSTPYPKSIIVTSTVPSEGKSYIATNIASMYSHHGHSTLIIDCDFRKPNQHKNFNISNDNGTLKWMSKNNSNLNSESLITDLGIQQEPNSGVYILPTGGSNKSPSSIINHTKFESLLIELKQYFQVIILDTPPLGMFSDSLFLSKMSDEAIYVCKPNHANRNKVRHCVEQLDRSHAELLGVVFSQNAKSSRSDIYGYHNYEYGEKANKKYLRYTS